MTPEILCVAADWIEFRKSSAPCATQPPKTRFTVHPHDDLLPQPLFDHGRPG